MGMFRLLEEIPADINPALWFGKGNLGVTARNHLASRNGREFSPEKPHKAA